MDFQSNPPSVQSKKLEAVLCRIHSSNGNGSSVTAELAQTQRDEVLPAVGIGTKLFGGISGSWLFSERASESPSNFTEQADVRLLRTGPEHNPLVTG